MSRYFPSAASEAVAITFVSVQEVIVVPSAPVAFFTIPAIV